MKNTSWIINGLLVSFLLFESCSSSDTTVIGNWHQVGAFAGVTRSGAFEFVIDNKAYVGLGIGGTGGNQYLTDCWVYDITKERWSKIAQFPGTPRELSVSFAVGGKGYVGTGYNRNLYPDSTELRYFNDFWQYDPGTDTWTQLGDFPGDRRYLALAIVANDVGYVGLGGNGNYYEDFYKYTPGSDTWEQIPDLSQGNKIQGAMTFTITGRTFVFGGDSNGRTLAYFYEFNPAATDPSQVWVSRSQISTNANYNDFVAAVHRSSACAFTLNDLGYIACGSVQGSPTQLMYQYNLSTDTWTKMTAFEGSARYQAVSYVLMDGENKQQAFVGCGTNGNLKFDDIWEWQPTIAYDPNN